MRAVRRLYFQQITTTWVAAQIKALLLRNGSGKQQFAVGIENLNHTLRQALNPKPPRRNNREHREE